jgi:pyruvate dehydrogenase E1 component alpha subunit/2-oxoisovalerate dehydrogenase E1 component alpha subunit
MADAKPQAAKRRSGQVACDSIELWSDEDWARATGLVQVLDERGTLVGKAPQIAREALLRMHEGMLTSRLLDEQLLALQRQGRISHYFEARGQEAAPIAAAEAMEKSDFFVQGLREGAVAVCRGMPLRTYIAQMLGSASDIGRARQMPCNVCSAELRHVSTSSGVASQIPHAVGIAMAARLRKERTAVVCFFGDGATSEDDFHAGLNFAAVYKAPVVFVCQNNQWAISTPVDAQTRSETLAVKGLAYAVPSLRIDGNDVLALHSAIGQALARARESGPSFIEAVTYRLGAHSSAGEPNAYRNATEQEAWQARDPLRRFGTWLDTTGVLSADAQASAKKRIQDAIAAAIAAEESIGGPAMTTLFDDVYAQPTWLLEEQKSELLGKS